MSVEDASRFLDEVDQNEKVHSDIKSAVQHFVQLGKAHGYTFTDEELDQALQKNWGLPENRKNHPHPYTCSCFSEPPGA